MEAKDKKGIEDTTQVEAKQAAVRHG